MSLDIEHTVVDRFVRYAQIDTQSDPESKTCPSTEKQKNLGKVLVEELLEMGISDAEMDEHGYIYATVPANTDKDVPVICFCSHMDTSPDASGTDVKPIIHEKWDGSPMVLPDDNNVVVSADDHPDLNGKVGNDIITASGLTLLGADNKAGLSEIMDSAHYLMTHPEVKHGAIRILFTPDEEIGRGVDKADMDRLGAKYGYTIDGEEKGHVEDSTFSADGVTLTIHGVSAHPGYAKGHMENGLKIAADILAALPKDRWSPETTEGDEGYVHPLVINGIAEEVVIKWIIRDFVDENLAKHEAELEEVVKGVMANYPKSSYTFEVQEQYHNMKNVVDQHPEIMDNALEAVRRAGLEPHRGSIRGGTDGSRLSYMGLPCPNIFTGGHAFHSKQEWVSVQDMEAAVRTIVHLCQVWEERA